MPQIQVDRSNGVGLAKRPTTSEIFNLTRLADEREREALGCVADDSPEGQRLRGRRFVMANDDVCGGKRKVAVRGQRPSLAVQGMQPHPRARVAKSTGLIR